MTTFASPANTSGQARAIAPIGFVRPVASTGTRRPEPLVSAAAMFDRLLTDQAAGQLRGPVAVRDLDGTLGPLPFAGWCAAADRVDRAALDIFRAELPAAATVLDLACGPGRHAAYLAEQGLGVLGVDISAVAVTLTSATGAAAMQLNVLGDLPGRKGWDGLLLLDGNIGLSGDPRELLLRVTPLLAPGGRILIELDPDNMCDTRWLQLSDGQQLSAPFCWARLNLAGLHHAAHHLSLDVLRSWKHKRRRFALIANTSDRQPPAPHEQRRSSLGKDGS